MRRSWDNGDFIVPLNISDIVERAKKEVGERSKELAETAGMGFSFETGGDPGAYKGIADEPADGKA